MNGQKETGTVPGPTKGFWAALKESIAKSNNGCGPGCGCHAADEKKKATGGEAVKDGRKA